MPYGLDSYGTPTYGDGVLTTVELPFVAPQIAFLTDPLDPSPVWQTIPRVGAIKTHIGRNREFDQYMAGTQSWTVDDTDRSFDPTNTSSPYFPNVIPGRHSRVVITYGGIPYFIADGYVDDFPQSYHLKDLTRLEIPHTDAFSVFSTADLPEVAVSWPVEHSGTRVRRVLDLIGWSPDLRDVDVGNSTLQGEFDVAGQSALDHFLRVAETENAEFYMTGAGSVRFRERHASLTGVSVVPQATFYDDDPSNPPGALLYEDLVPAFPRDLIRNPVRYTRVDGVEQIAEDVTVQPRYGRNKFERADLLNISDAEVKDAADFMLGRYKAPHHRFDKIVLTPYGQEAAMFPQILGRQIGDCIRIVRRPVGGGTLQLDVVIEGIGHDFDGTGKWETTWELAPSAGSAWWVLGTSALDIDTALAY